MKTALLVKSNAFKSYISLACSKCILKVAATINHSYLTKSVLFYLSHRNLAYKIPHHPKRSKSYDM